MEGGVSWGCSSLHFSTEGVIRRDRDERFRTNPARNIFRSADRGFTQWRENAIGAGRRSRGCGFYLKGIAPGDFEEALIALLGKDAGGLSASTIGRLKEAWSDEHTRWSKRDLSAKRYVYFWVDGIHVQARLEEAAQCLLVIIGATPEGKKELVGLIDGVRESA